MKFERKRDALVQAAALLSLHRRPKVVAMVRALKKMLSKDELAEYEDRRKRVDPQFWIRKTLAQQKKYTRGGED